MKETKKKLKLLKGSNRGFTRTITKAKSRGDGIQEEEERVEGQEESCQDDDGLQRVVLVGEFLFFRFTLCKIDSIFDKWNSALVSISPSLICRSYT
ncbi:hypothetical protein L1887_02193 [Cichorium endivia]|nr:hypothetical protein L1887_02193 [Cichorium endivia]